MEENNENKKVIDFEFEWNGKDFEKIMPNVIAMARKLLELEQIRVGKELDENGHIKILHTGVCRKMD